MKRRASLWVLCTTMAFAVAALVFTPAGEAVARGMRPLLVQIVNDSSAPVPVTGATSITGTPDVNVVGLPAVQAQQSGAWNVGINGTPTVNAHIMSGAFVGIDPANNTVQVAAPGTPIQVTLGAGLNTSLPVPGFFTVPADQRLIIEYVSGNCVGSDATSGVGRFVLTTTTGGTLAAHHFPFTPLPSPVDVAVQHTFAQNTRIHADPGTSVATGGLFFSSSGGSVSCAVVLSGSLVAP